MALPAIYNTIINYILGDSPSNPTKTVYSKAQVTALQGRTFGTWTIITAAVRLQAAYQIENKAVYELALFTFAAATLHFTLELLVFGTITKGDWMKLGALVDLASAIWMACGWYQGSYF